MLFFPAALFYLLCLFVHHGVPDVDPFAVSKHFSFGLIKWHFKVVLMISGQFEKCFSTYVSLTPCELSYLPRFMYKNLGKK